MEYALALLVLAAMWLRCYCSPCGRRGEEDRREETRIAELQAAKEAKSTARSATPSSTTRWGRSPRDWRAVDRDLRGEAIDILRELDRLEGRTPQGGMDR